MASEKITNIVEEIKTLTILELADLVSLCEEKYDVDLEEDKIREIVTVGDFIKYLESLVG